MNIVIISSSHRKNSNSRKTSNYLKEKIEKQDSSIKANILDLSEINLPFWDDRMWESSSNTLKEQWKPSSELLSAAEGFILVIPEWNGMSPASLHNLFLFCSNNELTHKPALITTVSAGIGGTYPISEIRMAGYKNTKICYLPEHLIFRNIESFLDETNEDKRILQMRERTKQTLTLFQTYCEAFISIREKDSYDHKSFGNGM